MIISSPLNHPNTHSHAFSQVHPPPVLHVLTLALIRALITLRLVSYLIYIFACELATVDSCPCQFFNSVWVSSTVNRSQQADGWFSMTCYQLSFKGFSLTSTSRLLLSLSTLTTLSLQIDSAFSVSPETSLITCLQGMPPLCHIDLVTPSSLLTSQICHFGEFPGVYALPAYQRRFIKL
jgi:hypothetical protein